MALSGPVAAQVTRRVSINSSGVEGNSYNFESSISADGRCVAFESYSWNLVPNDTNDAYDIFIRDPVLGGTGRVSVNSAWAQANGDSGDPSLSADGRYVAFFSTATNLDPADTNGSVDVFVRDRQLYVTERVSLDSSGREGNADSWNPSISADGRCVAFYSYSTNLVGGDTNGMVDVFVRDLELGVTERISVDSAGAQANDHSGGTSVSWDGRYVAFYSFARNLVSGDTNAMVDVFVRDRQLGTTERVSVNSDGAQGFPVTSFVNPPYRSSISADGRYVAFESIAVDLVSGDTNALFDVYVRDRLLGRTERVSVDSAGVQGNGTSFGPSISADGASVSFESLATNLVGGDTNAERDVFVRDRRLAVTERASVHTSGAQGNESSHRATISGDGRCVTFYSYASNLVDGDTNGSDDFVRERIVGPSFTSLCHPGVDGVIPCPCANPPGGPGRGCDNSSATGGAFLSAAGGTSLSADSLVFTTSAQTPAQVSVVVQGSALAIGGIAYGQGVRCVDGRLLRLYTRIASGGSITAPDLGWDLSVSERSAALGDPIQTGQSRRYFVYYRDPTVLGGCSSTSAFNATQAGEVAWMP